jgi:hypothetical protein
MAPADLTLAAFSFFSLLRLVSYLPQIWCVAHDGNGATAISYSTWAIWIGANASTAAYALVNLGDVWLATVNAVNTLCCTVVLGLAVWQRRRWRARSDRCGGGLLLR